MNSEVLFPPDKSKTAISTNKTSIALNPRPKAAWQLIINPRTSEFVLNKLALIESY